MSNDTQAAEATGAAEPTSTDTAAEATEAAETELPDLSDLELGADPPAEPAKAAAETEGEAEAESAEDAEPQAKADAAKADEAEDDDKIDLEAIRKERASLKDKLEAERKAREAEVELKTAREEAAQLKRIKELAKSDPLAAIEALEMSLEDAVDRALLRAEGKEPAPAKDDKGETARERELRLELEAARAEKDKLSKEAESRQIAEQRRGAISAAQAAMEAEGDRFEVLTASGVTAEQVYDEFAQWVSDYKVELPNEETAKKYFLAIADELEDKEVQRARKAIAAKKISGPKSPTSKAQAEATQAKPNPDSKRLSASNEEPDEDADLPLDPTARHRALSKKVSLHL